MKNILFTIIIAVSLLSCKEEIETSSLNEPGICVVSGKVKANTDMTNDGNSAVYENISDANITFLVNSSDLQIHPDENFEYEMLSFTTSIIDGEYTIELPAIARPYSVQVLFEELNIWQINSYWDNSQSDYIQYSTETFYTCNPQTLSNIIQNHNKTANFYYYPQ